MALPAMLTGSDISDLLFDGRPAFWALVLVSYVGALVVGFLAGRRGFGTLGLVGVLVACTVAPRMVMVPTMETAMVTGNERILAPLSLFLLGLGLATAQGREEKRIVLVPAALVWAGALLAPSQLLNPAMSWVSAVGAVFLLAQKWVPRRPAILAALVVLGTASILLLVPGVRAPNAVQYEHLGRPYGIFGNPILAADCLFFLGAAAACALWQRRRFWAVLVAGVAFVGIMMTGSKTGLLLVVLLAVATALGFYPTARGRPTRARVMGLLVAVVVLALVALPFAGRVLGRAATFDLASTSVQARLVGWQEGLVAAASRPLGGGRVLVDWAPEQLRSFENLFLDLGSRLGWLPLVGFVAALVLVWRRGCAPARTGVLAIVVAGLTAATYYHPSVTLISFVALGVLDSAGRQDASREGGAEVREPDEATPGRQAGAPLRLWKRGVVSS